jgi:hypothetical protein
MSPQHLVYTRKLPPLLILKALCSWPQRISNRLPQIIIWGESSLNLAKTRPQSYFYAPIWCQLAQHKKVYYRLYEPPKQLSISLEKQLKTSQNPLDPCGNPGDRVRLNLSTLCVMHEIFWVAANSFGLTKTAFLTSLLMQSLPVIAQQFKAVRTLVRAFKKRQKVLFIGAKYQALSVTNNG